MEEAAEVVAGAEPVTVMEAATMAEGEWEDPTDTQVLG